MIKISFPYPDISPLYVDEKSLIGIFSPSVAPNVAPIEKQVLEAIENPIGSPPLKDMLKGAKRVLILSDDYTRSTPTKEILPILLSELENCGIISGDIAILIALGTHRPMSEFEMERKLGRDICRRYKIVNHEWWDEEKLLKLGETESGIPVIVNRLVKEFDFLIGVGQIVPHRVTGFSGGGNIVQPGICGELTTGKTHWLAAQFTGREILGKIENPVKDEVERVALLAGLKWILNTIQDANGNVVKVVAGDPLLAYRIGAKTSFEVYKTELPSEADIVITDSVPFDSELWLAAKGIYASELAVKEGGVVILVSPCPEGVSSSHKEITEFGYDTYENIQKKVINGEIKKLTVAAHLVHVGRVIKEHARGIIVTTGIKKDEAEKIGFIYSREPQEALERAVLLLGGDPKIAVFKRGGEILPVIKEGS